MGHWWHKQRHHASLRLLRRRSGFSVLFIQSVNDGLLFRSLSRLLPFSLPGTTEGEEGQQTGSLGPRPAPLAALQNNCLGVTRLWAAPTGGSWGSVFPFFHLKMSGDLYWKSRKAQGRPPGTLKNNRLCMYRVWLCWVFTAVQAFL